MNPNHMKSVFLSGAALAVLAVGGAGPVSARDTAAAEQPDSAALELCDPRDIGPHEGGAGHFVRLFRDG